MSIEDEARAEASVRWPENAGSEPWMKDIFVMGAEWQASRKVEYPDFPGQPLPNSTGASRKPEAAPSDTGTHDRDRMGICRNCGRGITAVEILDGEKPCAASQPVQVDPREVAHIECDCVPDIGPSHCHLCSERAGHPMPWSEAHPQPVRVEVTDNTKLIDRAREMRMDAEVGTHVERMRILGELANALQASDAALSAALGGGE